MGEFAPQPLKSFCPDKRGISYGIVQPGQHWEGGVPIVRVNNFQNNRLQVFETLSVHPDIETKYARSRPQAGDILITLVGSIGQVAIATDEIEGWNLARAVGLIPTQNFQDAQWLYFALQAPDAQRHMHERANTTVQTTFNLGDLAELPIPTPSPNTRQKILEVLSALDDKIELNRRTNETLEAMAQAVFKDWFVDFGPVRRKQAGETDPAAILGGLLLSAPTGKVDTGSASAIAQALSAEKATQTAALFPNTFGDNGLPEGWGERPLEKDFEIVMGQSPPGDTYNEVGEGLVFFQGRRDFGWRFPAPRVYCSAPNRIADDDWTLVSVRAPVGDINRALGKCCIGRGVGAMMHKSGLASFTYYTGLHLREILATYDNDGTVFGSINQKQFKGLDFVGANTQAANDFDRLVNPIDQTIRLRTQENQTLAQTRDYLLPKLMSGQIRAGDVESMVA